ncbi:transcriptional regulator NrdR [Aerosakkonemataceae cyanobacterium BLCC-F154]|uniref:Transcriptional repressor NrdR n=1 Tax=Floridaenema fluviatile BLCC-F154 TaxID=3153640 RepID=A0ABV4YKJ1_9CYAN
MRCPFCNNPDNRVLESRSAEGGQSIRRRRECLRCKRRFTTYEQIEFVPVTVIKRDGRREGFDRSKLLRGIVRACEKTGISQECIEALTDEVESELQQREVREVTSNEIGELVLQKLRYLSEVAYVRFASVYRQFRGIADFIHTLNQLRNEHHPASREEIPTNNNLVAENSGLKMEETQKTATFAHSEIR